MLQEYSKETIAQDAKKLRLRLKEAMKKADEAPPAKRHRP